MTLTTSASEFAAFAEKWPSICGTSDGVPICMAAYEGRFEGSSRPRPSRDAVVLLLGDHVCYFRSGQATAEGDWLIFRSQYQNDTLSPRGPPNPLRSEVAPDGAAFARLCRTLREPRITLSILGRQKWLFI